MKRLSSEQIADLFNVTAGEAIQYDIVISYRLRRESWWETSQTRLIEGRGSLGSQAWLYILLKIFSTKDLKIFLMRDFKNIFN